MHSFRFHARPRARSLVLSIVAMAIALAGSPYLTAPARAEDSAAGVAQPDLPDPMAPTASSGVYLPSPTSADETVQNPPVQTLDLSDLSAGDEITELRTEQTRSFVTDRKGHYTTEFYASPVNYRDSDGEWQPIDTEIHAADGKLRTDADSRSVDMALNGGSATLAKIVLDRDHSVAFSLEGGSSAAKAHQDDDTVQYSGIAKNANLEFEPIAGGLKETIVLTSRRAPRSFTFPLKLRGLVPSIEENTGDVVYRDESGVEQLRTPRGYMEDSAVDPTSGIGARSDDVSYELVPYANGGVALRVAVDPAWLDDPSRVYPVRVDPTFSPVTSDDTFVMNSTPTADYSTSTQLFVGTPNAGTDKTRSFLKFDVSSLTGKIIDTANLQLFNEASTSCTAKPVGVYRVTEDWTGATWRGFPGPALGELVAVPSFAKGNTPGGCAAGSVSIGVKTAVDNWTNGSWGSFGFGLVANETDTLAWKRFSSAQGANPPKLIVDYHTPTGGAPIGSSDVIEGTSGAVHIQGWAIDPDTTLASRVAITVDAGPTQTPGVTANGLRADVGTANPGYGNNHGYDAYVDVPVGTHTVCVKALNTVGAGSDVQLGCASVTIGAGSDPTTTLTMSPNRATYAAGEAITFTATVANVNHGTINLRGITNTIPGGLLLTPGSVKLNGTACNGICSVVGNLINVTNFSLGGDATSTLQYQAIAVGQTRGCSLPGNRVDALIGVSSSVGAIVQPLICDTGLGLEKWTTFSTEPLGPQSQANVNVANGNLVVQAEDTTAVQARGRLSYTLRRTYNSQDVGVANLPGSWGAGWNLNVSSLSDTGGIAPTGLVVPTAINSLTGGLTLVDRDGTRHIFQPKTLTTVLKLNGALTGLNANLNSLTLPAVAGFDLCIDLSYKAPPGLHMSIFRYVYVATSSNCTGLPTSGVGAGYVAITPDRMRYEFNAAGRLQSQIDGAGVELRYLYDTSSRLKTIYEPRSCADPDLASLKCRKFSFAYPSSTQTDVTDPAGRVTSYRFDNATPRKLIKVINPDTTDVDYAYGGCGGSSVQLCSVTDPRDHATTFTYASQPFSSGPAQVKTLTDRRGSTRTFTYSGYYLWADLPAPETTVDEPNQGTCTLAEGTCGHRDRYLNIDSSGRVAEHWVGDINNNVVKRTTYTWDTATTPCRQPDNVVDNELCKVQRDGFGTFDNEITNYTYNPEGQLLIQSRTNGTKKLESSFGYLAQYVGPNPATNGGVVTYADDPVGYDTLTQRAKVTSTANGGAGDRGTVNTLYVLSDKTASLTPRGNEVGATIARFKTTYMVDNLSTVPANAVQPPSATVCSGGAATSNTGLVCATSSPAVSDTTTDRPVTRLHYNSFGEKTAEFSPRALQSGGKATTYDYYGDGTFDLTNSVSAAGWLKAIHDPTTNVDQDAGTTNEDHFVVFAYDRAGNIARTWDRDATNNKLLTDYPDKVVNGATVAPASYTETLHSSGADAYSTAMPWRYVVSDADQLHNKTVFNRDANGNALTITPPRGTSPQSATFDTTQTFDNNDNLQTQAVPTTEPNPSPVQFDYDPFDNLKTRTDRDGAVEIYRYDAANRKIWKRWSRGNSTDLAALPVSACRAYASATDQPIPSNKVVCEEHTTYDGRDNVRTIQTADQQVTEFVYDQVGRRTSIKVPRSQTKTLQTDTGYDVDGNIRIVCPPRHFDESAAACSDQAPTVFDAQFDYFDSGMVKSETRRRDESPVLAMTTTYRYDRDGNHTSTTDPNGFETKSSFDEVGRATLLEIPRESGIWNPTSTEYGPSGDVVRTTEPGGASGPRISLFDYDAAHRLVDTIKGATTDSYNSTVVTGSDGGTNIRTRNLYDADSNLVATYGPRGLDTMAELADPDERFMTRYDYDIADRPKATWVPRFGTASTDLALDTTQAAECPTTGIASSPAPNVPGYPSGTGVCRQSVDYNVVGRVKREHLLTEPADADRYVDYVYTDDGLLAKTTMPSPAGSATVDVLVAYDAMGRRAIEKDANGITVTTSYTADGLVSDKQLPSAADRTHLTSTTYNAAGQPITTTDARGKASKTDYFSDGLIRSYADANLSGTTRLDVTNYKYDKSGNPVEVKSPSASAGEAPNVAGTPTTYGYTADNLVKSIVQPVTYSGTTLTEVRSTTYEYDTGGRKVARTDKTMSADQQTLIEDGGRQTLSWFPDDRLDTETGRWDPNTTTDNPSTPNATITHRYDAAGNPTSVTDSTGPNATGNFYLDDLPRQVSSDSRTVGYAYNGAGDRSAMSDDGVVTTYGRNDGGVVTNIDGNNIGGTITLGYDAGGRPTTKSLPNGVNSTWDYDTADGALKSFTTSRSGTDISTWTYKYDNDFRVKEQTLTGTKATGNGDIIAGKISYGYDDAGRLNSVQLPGDTTAKPVVYDRDGNRTNYRGDAWHYNADGSLQSETVSTVDHTYGRPKPFGGMSNDGCSDYTYDGFDRLSSVTAGCSQPKVDYTYDGLDRQRTTTKGTATTSLHYDGWNSSLLAELSTTSAVGYALDESGAAVAKKASSVEQLDTDGRGNVTTITSTAGDSLCTVRYDPFGNVMSALSSTNPCSSGTTNSSILFAGARRDTDRGTYQFGSRTYDPTKASFLTPDTYRTGDSNAQTSVGTDPLTANTYAYVNGDPVNFSDPDGHARIPIVHWCIGKCGGKGKKDTKPTKEEALMAGDNADEDSGGCIPGGMTPQCGPSTSSYNETILEAAN